VGRCCVWVAPLLGFRVLDLGIRPQALDRRRDRLADNCWLDTNAMQELGYGAHGTQLQTAACHQSGDAILRRSQLGSLRGAVGGAEFDDDPASRVFYARMMRLPEHRVELAAQAGGSRPECG